ncbi:tetratricopeptide repeat protein [Sagittula salina]|uniref:Sel1 repeat family protein n=1 Tax=Sagittula salina TaxID=2820268 RepID=A0A940MQX2_9RHOB|nr:sel1 repeat family protein [Sagittula salina]MBP0483083.1 sel1 repeat family protein [Sagittula salina]
MKTFAPLLSRGIVLGAAILSLAPAATHAQEHRVAMTQEQPTQAAQTLNSRYKAVERLRKQARDTEQMQAVLEGYAGLAKEGHARSAFRMGNIFYRGTMTAPDAARGIDSYRKAAKLGYAPAWRYLAVALLSVGEGEAAFDAFAKARAAGIVGFDLIVAKAHLRHSFGGLSDPEAGLALLQTLTAAGDGRARMELGKTLSDAGSGFADFAAARRIFEELAGKGHGEATMRLAGLYRGGLGVPRHYPTAQVLYERAARSGVEGARLKVAEMQIRRGLFGNARRTLEHAVTDRVEGAEVALIDAEIRRQLGSRSDRAAALAALEEGLKSQDPRYGVLALELLSDHVPVSLDRDVVVAQVRAAADHGHGDSAAALLRAARLVPGLGLRAQRPALLESYRDLLRDATRTGEEVRIIMDSQPRSKAREMIAERLDEASPEVAYDVMSAVARADRNDFIWLVQSEFKRRGNYSGHLTGTLTGSTLRAMLRFCAAEGYLDECRHGPLRGTAMRLMSASLAGDVR